MEHERLDMVFWRRAARKSRKERTRNTVTRGVMNVEKDIIEIVERKHYDDMERDYGRRWKIAEHSDPWGIG